MRFIDSGQDEKPAGRSRAAPVDPGYVNTYSVCLLATDLFVVFMIFPGKEAASAVVPKTERDGRQGELNNKNAPV